MNRLDNLPQIANETLGGLKADTALYQKIVQKAASSGRPRHAGWQRGLALAFSLMFVLGLGAYSLRDILFPPPQPVITTTAAGDVGSGHAQLSADVPRGSITLSTGSGKPQYIGVWASGKGANFPLIRAEGRYYRLLSKPSAIDRGMLGGLIGSVASYVDEPALDKGSGILSNTVPEGGEVYHVSGMQGSAVAAAINGELRVFQRVAFNGQALTGGEGLAATLKGKVVGLQISGVGTITDAAKAQELMQTLLSSATYQNSSNRASDQALLIQYDNGIVLQMALKGSQLTACGGWEAQAFLDAFRAALPDS